MAKRKKRRSRDWSAAERLAAVNKAAFLTDDELGLFLREQGLHEADLARWQEQAKAALGPARKTAKDRESEREMKRLKRELKRKDAALAEAAALLVLSKKVNALWEDEGENT